MSQKKKKDCCSKCSSKASPGLSLFRVSIDKKSSLLCQNCFTCQHCSSMLDPKKFHIHKGSFYCINDFTELFIPKCQNCKQSFKSGEKYITTSDHHTYHPKCIKCFDCNQILDQNKIFLDKNDKTIMLCQKDHIKRNAPKCDYCENPMTKWTLIQNKCYCNKCFKLCLSCFCCRRNILPEKKLIQNSSNQQNNNSNNTHNTKNSFHFQNKNIIKLDDGRNVCHLCYKYGINTELEVSQLLSEVLSLFITRHGITLFKHPKNKNNTYGAQLNIKLLSPQEMKLQNLNTIHSSNTTALGFTLSEESKSKSKVLVKKTSNESFPLLKTNERGGGNGGGGGGGKGSGGVMSPSSVTYANLASLESSSFHTPSSSPTKLLRRTSSSSSVKKTSLSSSKTDKNSGDKSGDKSDSGAVTITIERVDESVEQNRTKTSPQPMTSSKKLSKSVSSQNVTTIEKKLTTTTIITHKVLQIGIMKSLPKVLCGAIIAHELGHAYLTLEHFKQEKMSPKLIEGLCELFARLWLQSLVTSPSSSSSSSSSDSNQKELYPSQGEYDDINTFVELQQKNIDPIYGDGLRTVLTSYEKSRYPNLNEFLQVIRQNKYKLP